MKRKETRLYNVVFPIWFLVVAWPIFTSYLPQLFLLLPINFLVDSLVVVLAAKAFRIPEIGRLWKKSVWKVWLLGFLCDFAGGCLIFLLCFLIEGGKITKALRGFTVAGNFYELLKAVSAVGSDLKFGLPSGSTVFGAPSVLVRELSIAGK